jgi:hypothetical protein
MSQALLLSIVGAKKCRWLPLQAQRQALIVTICHTRLQFKNCRSKWEQGASRFVVVVAAAAIKARCVTGAAL